MPSKAEILKEAEKHDQAADELYQRIKGKKLEPFITDNGEPQPPQEAVALGALRQRARTLRKQAA